MMNFLSCHLCVSLLYFRWFFAGTFTKINYSKIKFIIIIFSRDTGETKWQVCKRNEN